MKEKNFSNGHIRFIKPLRSLRLCVKNISRKGAKSAKDVNFLQLLEHPFSPASSEGRKVHPVSMRNWS